MHFRGRYSFSEFTLSAISFMLGSASIPYIWHPKLIAHEPSTSTRARRSIELTMTQTLGQFCDSLVGISLDVSVVAESHWAV
jgi:hypothetical protein